MFKKNIKYSWAFKTTAFTCFLIILVNAIPVAAWDRGGKSLDACKKREGVSFVNSNYNVGKTQFLGEQGSKGKNREDIFGECAGRYYIISGIDDSKEIQSHTVVYPKYLLFDKTYYDLELSVNAIFSNKSKASFGLGLKPVIYINKEVCDWTPEKNTITSIRVKQTIKESSGQKNPKPLKKLNYYIGWNDLDSNECIKYYGIFNDSIIFKDSEATKSTCAYTNSDNGITCCGMSDSDGNNKISNANHTVFFKNTVVKNNIANFRCGLIGKATEFDSEMKFFVKKPVQKKDKKKKKKKEKAENTKTNIINKAINFAKKYSDDNTYHYVNYEPNDKKTQQCPVCKKELKKQKKYKGWNCIGFVSACYHHAGVSTVSCRGGGIVNDYFANYSRINESTFKNRNGKKWKMIAKQNKKIPKSKLKKGDVIICYSGSTFKHIIMYAGNGYIFDCTSGKTQISKRKYDSVYFTPKVAFRYFE